MIAMTPTYPPPPRAHTRNQARISSRIQQDDLPATPDDIDLDRIVTDPEYRRAVQDLLRQWGIGDDADSQTVEKRSRIAGSP